EGTGLDELRAALTQGLEARTTLMHLAVPYERGDVVAFAHRLGEVIAEKHDEQGTLIDVRVPSDRASEFTEFASA
ncbi:MAG TPA: hypothetical protein VE173_06800, partial [Longimicrobiales bacterium]|nr:hypothetical protein [Longimicrobiales bacterium]